MPVIGIPGKIRYIPASGKVELPNTPVRVAVPALVRMVANAVKSPFGAIVNCEVEILACSAEMVKVPSAGRNGTGFGITPTMVVGTERIKDACSCPVENGAVKLYKRFGAVSF